MARRTTSATGSRSRRAFTLMEVLIVIALLGAVTAIAAMDLVSMFEGQTKPSSLELVRTAVDAGRTRALNAGDPVRMVFDPISGSLRLLTPETPNEFPLPGVTSLTFAIPAEDADGTELPVDALVFHPSGCMTPAVIDLAIGLSHTRYRVEMFSAFVSPEENVR